MAIDPHYNDVLYLIKNLAISCRHFQEFVEHEDRAAGQRVSNFIQFTILRDVANTFKHRKLRDASRQVQCEAELAFQVNRLGQLRYLRTVVPAENQNWKIPDLTLHLLLYINHCIEVLPGLNNEPVTVRGPLGEFADVAKVRLTETNYRASGSKFRFYKIDAEGDLKPVADRQFHVEIIDERSDTIAIGSALLLVRH